MGEDCRDWVQFVVPQAPRTAHPSLQDLLSENFTIFSWTTLAASGVVIADEQVHGDVWRAEWEVTKFYSLSLIFII